MHYSHLAKLAPLFNKKLVVSNNRADLTMKSLRCETGFASENSVCDAIFKDADNLARGVIEAKESTCSPVEAVRQGISEASNMACHQLKIGVSAAEIVVPIVGTTGVLMQFVALVLLQPSFPMVVNLSRVLDLSDQHDRRTAAGFLSNIKAFIDRPLQLTLPLPPPPPLQEFGLCRMKYLELTFSAPRGTFCRQSAR